VHVHLAADDSAGAVVLSEVGDQQLTRAVAHGHDAKPITPRELVPFQELVELLDRSAYGYRFRRFVR
jgi:hypothetical protein